VDGLRPLPEDVVVLLHDVGAPPRLVAHLRAVHDVAWQIADGLRKAYPELSFDRTEVLYGAATHDIGKALHPNELSEPGSEHEAAGCRLLCERGVPQRLARFAATHGAWDSADLRIEDLLVSLADKVWKAQRVTDLEDRVVDRIAAVTGEPRWQVFMKLDEVLERIARGADDRLSYQNSFSV
jgi:putative nucleotidyltransferase with HDIG domain